MSLKRLFNPESVAVVGASREEGKVGYEVLAALIEGGFEGSILPVNPRAGTLLGLRCYASLKEIEKPPDLAVIVVPPGLVRGIVEECVGLKIPSVVVLSSGFKESGPEGAEREREVLRVARSGGLRVIGPNCIGFMVPPRKLNASFAGDLPSAGGIAYVSQSGSIMAAIVDMANSMGIGMSKVVSIGNKADVDELALIREFGEDDDTRVIAGYLETIVDGDAFIRETERIGRRKPILIIKAGVTDSGAKAARSHTGRLAETESAYECVFERAGVVRCPSIKIQFDYARAFARQPLPRGERVAVIANAGGAGIMAADAIDRERLELAAFSEETRAELAANLQKSASIENPVDLLGDAPADRYELALRTALKDENVDAALVMLSPHATTRAELTAERIVRVTREMPEKPVLACFLGAGRVREAILILRQGGVPDYDSPEAAVGTFKAMARYARWKARPKRVVKLFAVNRRKVERILEQHLGKEMYELGEMPSKEILRAYGFVTPRGDIAVSADHAAGLARQIGFPVVLKVWSPNVVHKTEVGGVKTNLNSEQEVMDAFDLMMYRIPRKHPDADIAGILVEQMCTQGKEVILGMNRDPRFGPLMMFGMGGKLVEVLEDVVFYPAPLTAEEAREMLVRTRTYELLRGGGREERVDVDMIAEGLQRLSQLVTEFPEIKEVDINPFVVGPEGTTPIAVDTMMTVEPVKRSGGRHA